MIFIWGFFLSVWWVWETPKIEKWRSGRQPGTPFFRCVATLDVLANQQVTPVWQAPFSASVHTLAVLAILSNLSPQPLCSAFFTPTRTLFSP